MVVHACNARARDQGQADAWGLLASQHDLIRERSCQKTRLGVRKIDLWLRAAASLVENWV